MDIKKDILWRVYMIYIAIICVCILIFSKAVYIQQVEGAKWRNLGDTLHQRTQEIEAERGTIYSEDGEMLSTSIPYFDVYIDFNADGLRDKKGKLFKDNVDSLSIGLANLFKDKTSEEYKRILRQGYKEENRYFSLKKSINYSQYLEMKKLPLVRLGKNKSGFITDSKSLRLNPYQMLAFRTIGLARDSNKVGLELAYDTLLKGKNGSRVVRYVGGGISMPIDEDEQEDAQNGKDIVSTINVFIQEVTEQALLKMMRENESEHGCAIVMETATGKIKAIANLGKGRDTSNAKNGGYWEDNNYALFATEPGSTFKLATMFALLEDKKINLHSTIDLQGGKWELNDKLIVYDAEEHGKNQVSVKEAFELSSNVGMAKLAWFNYQNNPSQFTNRLHQLNLDMLTGIDLVGERNPVIHKPSEKGWNNRSMLPWMAFGYSLQVTPLRTLTLYNAIANKGKMMKPYLVSSVKEEGAQVKEFEPIVLNNKICSDETLSQLSECLKGVCSEPGATGYALFKGSPYKVAGKTGTSLVQDRTTSYVDKVYQSSFVGYFPADNPQYTICVVIKNKKGAKKYFGAAVAGPVFKEIADRLYTTYVKDVATNNYVVAKKDSSRYHSIMHRDDIRQLAPFAGVGFNATTTAEWFEVNKNNKSQEYAVTSNENNLMPQLKGMSAKDAVYLCDVKGIKVNIKGKGKVTAQSISPNSPVDKNKSVELFLN